MTDLKYLRRIRNIEEHPIASHVLQVNIDDIRPNRAQPRSDFDNNSIIRLADSIRRYGIIQPLTVRRTDSEDSYTYELVAGERRLRAAKMLGYFTVPCILIEADEKMSAEMAIIENLLRKDLNMFEQAYGFKKLIDNHGLTQDEVARRMSVSQSAIANKIRLLKLSDVEQKSILEHDLTERHARALLKIDSPELRTEAIRYIVSMSLNVVNTEQYIESILKRTEFSKEQPEKRDMAKKLISEKNTLAFVESMRKKITSLNKQGKNASISVTSSATATEVYIKIYN